MSIHVREISKSFGSFKALDRVSLEVPEGTLLALLGPSGSGKTTLLRIIAGLEVADEGVIEEDGEDITERHAREREVGFVFQHCALFGIPIDYPDYPHAQAREARVFVPDPEYVI